MATLTRLDVPNKYIHDLTGLEFATNLTRLDLGTELVVSWQWVHQQQLDLRLLNPLSSLTNLDLLGS